MQKIEKWRKDGVVKESQIGESIALLGGEELTGTTLKCLAVLEGNPSKSLFSSSSFVLTLKRYLEIHCSFGTIKSKRPGEGNST